MSILYTKQVLKRHVTSFFMQLNPNLKLNAHHEELIEGSILAAMMEVCSDYNIDQWRFNREEVDLILVPSVDHSDVDLTDPILQVVSDSIRITEPACSLKITTKEAILAHDQPYEQQGLPQVVAIERATYDSLNPDAIRLYLWPIPDAAYNLKLTVILASCSDPSEVVPSFLNSALKTKVIEYMARWMNYGTIQFQYAETYRRDLQKYKTNNNSDNVRVIRNDHGRL